MVLGVRCGEQRFLFLQTLLKVHARESSKEYLKHLSIVQGSLAELQTQIELAMRLQFIEPTVARQSLEFAASLSRQIFALRNAIARKVEEGY